MIIYKITNKINGKIYVGQTINELSVRFKNHCQKTNRCPLLKKAMQKYGRENFKIEKIDSANSKDELNEKEIYWIKELNSFWPNGYNATPGGNGITEETIAKIVSKNTGRKRTEKQKIENSLAKQRRASINEKSGYKGVSPRYGGKTWRAIINVNHNAIYLGGFHSKEEAALAYDKAAIKYHCEDCYLNFPLLRYYDFDKY